jgi:transcriptional regulator of acetoin/glycerol metabolism
MKQGADLLGVSRTTLWEKMRRLGLAEERWLAAENAAP